MKTVPKSIVYLLLISTISIYSSCKKDNPEAKGIQDNHTITADTLNLPLDTIATNIEDGIPAKAYDNGESAAGSAQKESSKSTVLDKAQSNNAKDKDRKSLKGYSAPDGTDAENHDGDQYTKNDNKRMPSGGTSIK